MTPFDSWIPNGLPTSWPNPTTGRRYLQSGAPLAAIAATPGASTSTQPALGAIAQRSQSSGSSRASTPSEPDEQPANELTDAINRALGDSGGSPSRESSRRPAETPSPTQQPPTKRARRLVLNSDGEEDSSSDEDQEEVQLDDGSVAIMLVGHKGRSRGRALPVAANAMDEDDPMDGPNSDDEPPHSPLQEEDDVPMRDAHPSITTLPASHVEHQDADSSQELPSPPRSPQASHTTPAPPAQQPRQEAQADAMQIDQEQDQAQEHPPVQQAAPEDNSSAHPVVTANPDKQPDNPPPSRSPSPDEITYKRPARNVQGTEDDHDEAAARGDGKQGDDELPEAEDDAGARGDGEQEEDQLPEDDPMDGFEPHAKRGNTLQDKGREGDTDADAEGEPEKDEDDEDDVDAEEDDEEDDEDKQEKVDKVDQEDEDDDPMDGTKHSGKGKGGAPGRSAATPNDEDEDDEEDKAQEDEDHEDSDHPHSPAPKSKGKAAAPAKAKGKGRAQSADEDEEEEEEEQEDDESSTEEEKKGKRRKGKSGKGPKGKANTSTGSQGAKPATKADKATARVISTSKGDKMTTRGAARPSYRESGGGSSPKKAKGKLKSAAFVDDADEDDLPIVIDKIKLNAKDVQVKHEYMDQTIAQFEARQQRLNTDSPATVTANPPLARSTQHHVRHLLTFRAHMLTSCSGTLTAKTGA